MRKGFALKVLLKLLVGGGVGALVVLAWVVGVVLVHDARYGVSSVVNLRRGERLVGASWRDSNLWILTRVARDGESPGEYVFREVSRMGWFEESVTVRER